MYISFNTYSEAPPSSDKCTSACTPHLFEKTKKKQIKKNLSFTGHKALKFPQFSPIFFSTSGKRFSQTQAGITSNVLFIICYFPFIINFED